MKVPITAKTVTRTFNYRLMKIKTISYQRVLNLGNYESKRLELLAEVFEGENAEEAISRLMEKVERKVREETEQEIKQEILSLQDKAAELMDQISDMRSQLKALKFQLEQPGKDEPTQPSPTFGILPCGPDDF